MNKMDILTWIVAILALIIGNYCSLLYVVEIGFNIFVFLFQTTSSIMFGMVLEFYLDERKMEMKKSNNPSN